MSFVLRVRDGAVYNNAFVDTTQEMSDFVAPLYAGNVNIRVYLFECTTSTPAPVARAVFRTFDPADENHIIYYVESLSGAKLFDFDFYLA
jgi:hypothetical protein